MTLIKSISGIRGTIGGEPGNALTPVDIVKFTYAYCVKLRERLPKPEGERYKVVVGKDARISGEMVEQLVCGSLLACGVDVVKAGFASTPTTEMAVIFEKADGGIILTASHNPKQWNALKLLNEKGEFLNAAEGAAILECADSDDFDFADVDSLGIMEEKDFTDLHIDAVLALEAVDAEAVRKAGFKVVSTTNGREAWEQLLEYKRMVEEEGRPLADFVQVVVSDIEMPVMDGLNLTLRIKEDPLLKHLPVLLFSSLITDKLRHKGESVGADGQISKPEVGSLARRAVALIEARFDELQHTYASPAAQAQAEAASGQH